MNKCVSNKKWLELLKSDQGKMDLNLCRYHCRSAPFYNNPETIADNVITLVVHGAIEVQSDSATILLQSGACIWLPPGTRRSYSKNDSGICRYYNLRFNLRYQDQNYTPFKQAEQIANAYDIIPVFEAFYDLFMHPHDLHKYLQNGLLMQLSCYFINALKSHDKSKRFFLPGQRLKLNQYITENINRKITTSELAKLCSLSSDYFSRIFKNTFKMSPRSYIKYERMHIAAMILKESNLTIEEIAYKLGMYNASFFCRQFKDIYSCTPGEYRYKPGSSILEP